MKWPYIWIPKFSGTQWYIIIHHSLTKDGITVSWNAIRNYHINELGWDDVGYQFGIELVNTCYEVLTGRPIGTQGAHCKQNGMNKKSIGICFVGNYDEYNVPDAMYHAGIKLIAGLCRSTPCNPELIYPHHEYADYKTCPGTRFDMDRLRNGVIATL